MKKNVVYVFFLHNNFQYTKVIFMAIYVHKTNIFIIYKFYFNSY